MTLPRVVKRFEPKSHQIWAPYLQPVRNGSRLGPRGGYSCHLPHWLGLMQSIIMDFLISLCWHPQTGPNQRLSFTVGAGGIKTTVIWLLAILIVIKLRVSKLHVILLYHLQNTWMKKNLGVVQKIFRKICITKKKLHRNWMQSSWKIDYLKNFYNKIYFLCHVLIWNVFIYHLMYVLPM